MRGNWNWQTVVTSGVIALLLMVGLVLAQTQAPAPTQNPKAGAAPEALPAAPANASQPPLPQITPTQEAISGLRLSRNPYVGTVFDQAGDKAEEAAVINRALAAEEAAHKAQAEKLPPLIQPIDEVKMVAEQLRELGRHLDLIAADQEDQGAYERADRLRLAAARIRREARDIHAAKADPAVLSR